MDDKLIRISMSIIKHPVIPGTVFMLGALKSELEIRIMVIVQSFQSCEHGSTIKVGARAFPLLVMVSKSRSGQDTGNLGRGSQVSGLAWKWSCELASREPSDRREYFKASV